jgi:hypothetical protein
MNASPQKPAPAPQARTAHAAAAPAGNPEPTKPASAVTFDRPHDDHTADEPGYGHGV